MAQAVVAQETAVGHRVGHGQSVAVDGGVPGGPSARSLLLHEPLEALVIDGEALAAQDVLGQVHGKAVGVVQPEGHVPGQRLSVALAQFSQRILQQDQPLVQGVGEARLFGLDRLFDAFRVGPHLVVGFSQYPGHRLHQPVQERLLEPQEPPVAGRPPEQPAQHVAAAVVARKHPVGDEKAHRPGVVGDDAKRDVRVGVLAVGLARQLLGGGDDVAEQVHVVVREDPLQHRGSALEPHAGVHVFGRQIVEQAVGVPVVLDEDEVPELDVAGAVGVDGAHMARLAGVVAGLGTPVHVDLAARTAGAGVAHLPEVVLLVETLHVAGRQAADAAPQPLGLVVVAEHGGVELVLGESPFLREKLPGPGDGLFLVVVAEGPVPQHLEKGVVVGVPAHRFQVVVLAADAQALLGTGGALERGPLDSEEDVLELDHARVGEQQGRVLVRHQRRALHHRVGLVLEEVEEAVANLFSGRHDAH